MTNFDMLKNNPNVQMRYSARYPELCVAKYKRNVFYNNLWDDVLVECRGHVWNHKTGNRVVNSFTKIFNRGENGTDIGRDENVLVIRKVNGFMASATYVPELDQVVVGTTGSLDSEFVDMAEEYIDEHVKAVIKEKAKYSNNTWLFEIVHPNDPHIIKETFGAYLIGCRNVNDDIPYISNKYSEMKLDQVARDMGVNRPGWHIDRFSDVVRSMQDVKHEGYVVYSDTVALKIKSPYYLTTKFFARIGTDKLLKMSYVQLREKVDEEYYDLIDHVLTNKESFVNMNEQERIMFVEEFFNGR